MRLYGIPNCDTVRKARQWLDAHGVAYRFHDFKKQGLAAQTLDEWVAALGWEPLLNRRGTTWRQLDAATQAAVTDAASAKALLLRQPSLIKRPVVAWDATAPSGTAFSVGFSEAQWAQRLAIPEPPPSAR